MAQENLNFNELLDRLYSSLPEKALSDSRFELPVVESMVQGKQTIWRNFSKIAKYLKRDEKQLYKFVMNDISTSSVISDGALILNGIFDTNRLNQILMKYINSFVLCSVCNKPDTEIITQNGIKVLRCTACGAITPLPKL